MGAFFQKICDMSLTASVIILFVLAARLALKQAPKIYSYALWLVVLFRLLCPVSIAAPVSVLEAAEPVMQTWESVNRGYGMVQDTAFAESTPQTENLSQEPVTEAAPVQAERKLCGMKSCSPFPKKIPTPEKKDPCAV